MALSIRRRVRNEWRRVLIRLPATLKHQLQGKLELPRGRRRRNLPGRVAIGVFGAVANKNDRIRVEEIRVIEEIERLRPELQVKSLVDTELLEKRSVGVDQTGSPDRPARDVPKGSGNRQDEGLRIEPMIHGPQNRVPVKGRIPTGHVGDIGIASSGIVEANHRRLGEATLSGDDPVPLPAADQKVLPPGGPASEVLAISERQLIAEVGSEDMRQAVGRRASVQEQLVGTEDIGRLILAGWREDGRIQVNHFRPGVIGFEREPVRDALLQRNIQRVIAGGTLIDPLRIVGYVWIRAR